MNKIIISGFWYPIHPYDWSWCL